MGIRPAWPFCTSMPPPPNVQVSPAWSWALGITFLHLNTHHLMCCTWLWALGMTFLHLNAPTTKCPRVSTIIFGVWCDLSALKLPPPNVLGMVMGIRHDLFALKCPHHLLSNGSHQYGHWHQVWPFCTQTWWSPSPSNKIHDAYKHFEHSRSKYQPIPGSPPPATKIHFLALPPPSPFFVGVGLIKPLK